MIKTLLDKNKEIILYLFFGVCTTLVNIIVYYFCSHLFYIGTTISTAISWLLSVSFAYITNKVWVFNSKVTNKKILYKEMISFYGCRLTTGIIDLIIMIIFVEIFCFNDMIIKILSNVLVIVLNYVASKLYVFNNNK